MKTLYKLSVVVFGLIASASVNAGGVFDFLDPCIAAKDDYWDQRGKIIAQFDQAQASNTSAIAPKEFEDIWWKEKTKVLKEYFDEKIAPIIKLSGGNVDKGFDVWLAKMVSDSGGADAIKKLVDEEYRRIRELAILKQKSETQSALDSKKKELYGQCPSDVASQVFRGTITIVTAPVGIILGNLEAAKNESGDVDKALRATTGISIGAIKNDGVLGGKESEARKACNAVAGVFGGKC